MPGCTVTLLQARTNGHPEARQVIYRCFESPNNVPANPIQVYYGNDARTGDALHKKRSCGLSAAFWRV